MSLPQLNPGSAVACPRTRPWDVTTTLCDVAVITWAIPPERLMRYLPAGFAPEIVRVGGNERALISAVPFRDLDFRFGFAPCLRFRFGQTNYRAYVRRADERCVWFFGTSLASRWVWLPRHVWRLPWHHARMRFHCVWQGERCMRYALATRSRWGDCDLTMNGTDEPSGCLDGFVDAEETSLVLTHPLHGYFTRRDGRVGTYSVWHERLQLCRAEVTLARFGVFERLGLVLPGEAPHSALVQRRTEFLIQLPPRALPAS